MKNFPYNLSFDNDVLSVLDGSHKVVSSYLFFQEVPKDPKGMFLDFYAKHAQHFDGVQFPAFVWKQYGFLCKSHAEWGIIQ